MLVVSLHKLVQIDITKPSFVFRGFQPLYCSRQSVRFCHRPIEKIMLSAQWRNFLQGPNLFERLVSRMTARVVNHVFQSVWTAEPVSAGN